VSGTFAPDIMGTARVYFPVGLLGDVKPIYTRWKNDGPPLECERPVTRLFSGGLRGSGPSGSPRPPEQEGVSGQLGNVVL
jgi:hypothetical protein